MKSRVLLLICVGALCIAPGMAQNGTGVITGHVTDPTGALVAGAIVDTVNLATGVRLTTTTNSAGIYEFLGLTPGRYQVEASAKGFKKVVRASVLVEVEDHLGLDFKLEIGNIAEVMTVTAEAPLLRTEDAQTGEVVNNRMIETLPQIGSGGRTGRDPLDLMTLSGEVRSDLNSSNRAGYDFQNNNTPDVTINGGRTSGIDYLVDGIPATMGRSHSVTPDTPSTEDVAEFKVITNGISAEYGRISGGVVSMVTSSGTNAFHGQLFEYTQSDVFNSNSWANGDAHVKKPKFHQNDFGLAIGGPVRLPHLYDGKDKTFFFANFEGFRVSNAGSVQYGSVPTAQERTGDLSDIGVAGSSTNPQPQMYNPYGAYSPTKVVGPDGNLYYQKLDLLGGDGMHVPSDMISPTSAAILAMLPQPNHSPAPGTGSYNNYQALSSSQTISNTWAVRLDHSFTSNTKMFGRFTHQTYDNRNPSWFGPLTTSNRTRTPGGFGAMMDVTHTFSPTLIMDVRVGGNFAPYLAGNLLPAGFNNSKFQFDAVTQSFLGPDNMLDIPLERENGGGPDIANSQSSKLRNSTAVDLHAAVTKIWNRHTVAFGFEGRRFYDDYNDSGQGYSWFDCNPVDQWVGLDQTWSPQGNSNSLGAFLLGLNDWMWSQSYNVRELAQNYYASYAQDDFKVSPKLTLNLGIRWEMESPTTERNNKLYFWDPNAPAPFTINTGYDWNAALTAAGVDPSTIQAPSWVQANAFPKGAVRIAGTPEHPSRYGQGYHPWQFSPRIGFAYQLNQATVLRGSFAEMYLPTTGWADGFGGSPGDLLTSGADSGWQANNFGMDPSIGNWTNPYRPTDVTTYTRNNQQANYQSTGAIGAGGISTTMHMPHEYDWSLGIQRQLPYKFLVEAVYAGNASNTLLAKNVISRFPKNLFVPANANVYGGTSVASPTAGQTREDQNVGTSQKLGLLEYPYPYFNTVQEVGDNIGSSHYESANLKVQRRLSNGLQMLFNYTFSKLLDNVGGPEAGTTGTNSSYGEGGKVPQTVDTIKSVYGYSPLDETHRISVFVNYALPFGPGRPWLAHPAEIGPKVLSYVVGGWEFSGESVWHSGTPIVFGYAGGQQNINVRVDNTYGSLAPGATLSSLRNSNFKGAYSVFIDPNLLPYPSLSTIPFNNNAIVDAQAFTYGTMPAVYAGIRNPGNVNANLSMMKRFPIMSESRYLEFRMEGSNMFNHLGVGSYNTTFGSPGFGAITGPANGERHIQLSMRLVF